MLIRPLSEISFKEYVWSIKDALICSLIALIPTLLFVYYYTGNAIVELAIGGCLFVAIYIGAVFVINRSLVNLVLSVVKK